MARKLTIDPKYFLLILPAYGVFIGFDYMAKALGDGGMSLGEVALSGHARALEVTGRFRVMAAGLFDIAVGLGILAVFAVNLWAAFVRRVWWQAGVVILAGAAIGITASMLVPTWVAGVNFLDLFDKGLFFQVLTPGEVSICAAGLADCRGTGAARVLVVLANPINIVTSFAAPAVLLGMILSLAQAEGEGITAEGLKRSHEILQRYLYLAGLILSSGMFFLASWMNWPGLAIADGATRAVYGGLVNSITLYMGTGFTMMILVTYLPIMLILRIRTEAVGRENVPDEDIPAATYTDGLKTIAAILSPILASAVGGFGAGGFFQ